MKRFFFVLLFISAMSTGYSKVGDTVVIQTIDHTTPPLPWWNAPRDGRYDFPTDKRWEKILMYYNLKCDPSQTPKCGEWDYLTYTTVIEHTGEFDTPIVEHIWFTANGKPISRVDYIDDGIAYKYSPVVEEKINYTKTNSIKTSVITLGSADITIDKNKSGNARIVNLYKASEITDFNDSKKITGVNLTLSGSNKCKSARIKVELKNTDESLTLPTSLAKMTTVFYSTVDLTSNSKVPLHFNTPFTWDGKSDIIVSYSFENVDDSLIIKGSNSLSGQGRDLQFTTYDGTADFGYGNYVDIPTSELNQKLGKNITISFWAYGDPAAQPQDASLFEAVDANNNRILNAHLPWGDGKVYWDCVGGRVSKATPPSNWEGRWSHWTFTCSESGSMYVYLDGKSFGMSTGTKKDINGIDKFRLGTSISFGPTFYGGAVDNFYIFNKALSKTEALQLMYNNVKPSDELYSSLVLGYNFDELNGANVVDIKGKSNGSFVNNITRKPHGSNRFKSYTTNGSVPNIELEFREYESETKKQVTEDISEMYNQYMIFYKVENNSIVVDETKLVTPAYWKDYVYNQDGIATDSTLVTPKGSYENKTIEYNGEPVERLIEWEIGRYITPYGNGLDLGNDGWTWVYDVSDFAPLLKGNVHLRAGNWQELLDLKFVMIEGVPDRDVIGIENAWKGRRISLTTFDEEVKEKEFTMPENAKMMKLRTTVTGHDFDNSTNCAEFCDKLHSIWVNGNKAKEWQIIKPCGANPLYPQGGTWIYDRAGWCPGEPAVTEEFELTDFVQNNKVKVDYNIQSDPYGVYDTDSQVVYYTDLNHELDATMEEILSPNNTKLYSRFNPSCGNSIIVIRNKGRNIITNAIIKYGIEGKTNSQYNWTGSLKYNECDTITLTSPEWDYKKTTGRFYAEIIATGDEYPTNNKKIVTYENSRITERTNMQFKFKTNKKPKDTQWILTELNTGWSDRVDINTLTSTTEYIYDWELPAGCYRLTLLDESGDGLGFWALPHGTGSAELFSRVDDEAYKSFYKFNPDFGSYIHYDFVIDPEYIGINNIAENHNVKLYPNPIRDHATITTSGYTAEKVVVYNISGMKIMEENYQSDTYNINTSNLPAGIYMIKVFISNNNVVTKKMVKK